MSTEIQGGVRSLRRITKHSNTTFPQSGLQERYDGPRSGLVKIDPEMEFSTTKREGGSCQ